jgi:hypothetical protein
LFIVSPKQGCYASRRNLNRKYSLEQEMTLFMFIARFENEMLKAKNNKFSYYRIFLIYSTKCAGIF